MNVIQAILLGIIQGITEWLPVSSSGHLVIGQELMGIESPLFFDAMVHLGTLIVVVWVFRQEVRSVFLAGLEIIGDLARGVPFHDTLKDDEHHFAFLVFVGSIPTAIIGLAFRNYLESLYSNLRAVGIALVITGCYLYFTRFLSPSERHGIKDMTTKESLLIGMMQGLAIIPGISRSGTTISTGIYCGLDKEMVMRYSFILFIPAILGATIIQAWTVISRGENIEWIPTITGMVTAMIVGYYAIQILLGAIRKSKLHLFSWYCWAAGILVTIATFM